MAHLLTTAYRAVQAELVLVQMALSRRATLAQEHRVKVLQVERAWVQAFLVAVAVAVLLLLAQPEKTLVQARGALVLRLLFLELR